MQSLGRVPPFSKKNKEGQYILLVYFYHRFLFLFFISHVIFRIDYLSTTNIYYLHLTWIDLHIIFARYCACFVPSLGTCIYGLFPLCHLDLDSLPKSQQSPPKFIKIDYCIVISWIAFWPLLYSSSLFSMKTSLIHVDKINQYACVVTSKAF
jgi:hypothetical protein